MKALGPQRRATFAAALLIVVAGLLTYHNSLSGPFILDDSAITDNPSIRNLWDARRVLLPPADGGAIARRPIANLTLAVNRAVGGTDVRGYHVFNLAAHLFAALTLFAVVRRSLRRPAVRDGWGLASTPLALIVALIWTTHPLQTNAVTYVIQRTEVLAGLFYLLTLLCVIRGSESPRPRPWHVAAVGFCLLAMGSKESAVSAPLVVLLYDRLFLAGSWRETLARRWGLYLGLATTWCVPAFFVSQQRLALGDAAVKVLGQGESTALDYVLAQFESIALYLRLSFWPRPLILDYGPSGVKSLGQVAPFMAVVGTLAAATVAALRRRPAVGFLGVWFFAILAPSSIVPIIPESAAEKRMYLPLAAVVVATVGAAHCAGRRWATRAGAPAARAALARNVGYAAAAAAVAALIVVSVRRNEDYRSRLSIWSDNVAKRSGNPRANISLGNSLAEAGRPAEAVEQYREAIRLDPSYADAYYNFGKTLADLGNAEEAAALYLKAIELRPDFSRARNNLGVILVGRGQFAAARTHFERALEADPAYVDAQNNIGFALFRAGKVDAAIAAWEKALRMDPGSVDARGNYGLALALQGRSAEAIAQFERVLEANPDHAETHWRLGKAYYQQSRLPEAAAQWREAIRLQPKSVEKLSTMAWHLATSPETSFRDGAEAVELAQRAAGLTSGRDPKVLRTLAAAHAETGDYAAARRAAEQALALVPDGGDAALAGTLRGEIAAYRAGASPH